jgi:hypothetical protein
LGHYFKRINQPEQAVHLYTKARELGVQIDNKLLTVETQKEENPPKSPAVEPADAEMVE